MNLENSYIYYVYLKLSFGAYFGNRYVVGLRTIYNHISHIIDIRRVNIWITGNIETGQERNLKVQKTSWKRRNQRRKRETVMRNCTDPLHIMRHASPSSGKILIPNSNRNSSKKFPTISMNKNDNSWRRRDNKIKKIF